MSLWLKLATATTVVLGPFVDDTDGKTAETALSIAQSDIRLSKNGGAFAQAHDATGATHMENGYYSVPLDATDTGTLGRLVVAVSKSGALPVWQSFQVVPANVYDALVGGSDSLDVDAVAISGSGTAADNVEAYIANLDAAVSSRLAAASYTAPDNASISAIKAKTDNLPAQPAAVGSQMDLVNVPNATAVAAIQSGLALEANVEGHVATALAAYDPPTKAEMDAALLALNDVSAAEVADAVWDEAIAGHSTAGSAGAALAAAGAAGDPWSTPLPGAYAAGTAGNILGTRLDRAISTAEANIRGADNDTLKVLSDQIDGLPTDADVRAQADAALAAYDPPTKAEMDAGHAVLATPAQVLTQATTALNTYDPPTKAEMDAAKAAIIAAMPPAPPTVVDIDNRLSSTHGAGLWSGAAGSGAIQKTYTLTLDDGVTPIAGADVWVTTDLAGSNVVASGVTDAFGQVTFFLDPGTYYIWRQLAGYNFSNPDTEVVP